MNRALFTLLTSITLSTACGGTDEPSPRISGSGVLIHTTAFAETSIYDATNPADWTLLATVPNYIYGIHDIP